MTQPAGPPGALAAVLANVGWLLAGKGVGAALSLVYLALAARSLGPERFGQFTLVLSTGQAAAALAGFDTWQIVVRYGMPHLQAGAQAELARVIAFCTRLDIGAALAGCVLASAGVLVLAPVFGWSAELCRAALAFCVVTLLSVRSTPVGVLRLFDRFAVGAAADATTPVMRFVGALVAVWLHAGVDGFLLTWASSEVATAIAYWLLARRVAAGALRLRGASRAGRENPGLWHFTWMTNLGLTLSAVGRQFSVLVVGVATGATAAGDFRLAFQLSQAVVRVSEMVARAAFAEFARTHAGRSHSATQRLITRLTLLAGAAGLSALLALLLGRPLLGLIAGRGHAGAYLPLQLLGLAAAIDLAGVGFEPVLTAIGRASLVLKLRLLATLCLIAGIAVWLPRYAANGVAAAMLVASICAAILLGVATLRAVRALPATTRPG